MTSAMATPLSVIGLLPVRIFSVSRLHFQTPTERRQVYNEWRRQWRKDRKAKGKPYA